MIVIRDPKTLCFQFDLPKDADENLKREIEFFIKSNECLVEIMIKNDIEKISNLSHRLNLRNWDKHVALQNISIYYTWKNIRKQ